MKRLLMLSATFLFLGTLIGCSSDSHEGLISETIALIDAAGGDVGNIKNELKKAVDKLNKNETTKLDLVDTLKAVDQLKKTGEKTQETKRKIEQVRAMITDEERKKNADSKKNQLNTAFKNLLSQKQELREMLHTAEKLDQDAIRGLRKKIEEAESPFEAQARQ